MNTSYALANDPEVKSAIEKQIHANGIRMDAPVIRRRRNPPRPKSLRIMSPTTVENINALIQPILARHDICARKILGHGRDAATVACRHECIMSAWRATKATNEELGLIFNRTPSLISTVLSSVRAAAKKEQS